MDTKICIATRRSVRRFQDKPIARELISQVIGLAQSAPSWKNSQTVRYYYIDDAGRKEQIAQQAMADFPGNGQILRNAPAMIVVASVNGVCGYEPDGSFSSPLGRHWQSFDAGLSVQTLCLSLHEAGLGSVIMGLFDPAAVAELAGIPKEQTVSCVLAVGYPGEGPHGRENRISLEHVLTFL